MVQQPTEFSLSGLVHQWLIIIIIIIIISY